MHDIICMANNMECRDAYIIIGIDEEKECSIQDVKNDSNRRNTQKTMILIEKTIMNFLHFLEIKNLQVGYVQG